MPVPTIPGEVADAIETAANDKADERYVLRTGIDVADLPANRDNDLWRLFQQTEDRRLRAVWAIVQYDFDE